MDTMAKRLAEALRQRKMKPMDLKRATGLSKAAVYFLLDGTTKAETVRDATVEVVCGALRINRAWLLHGKGPMDSGRIGTASVATGPVSTLDEVRHAQLLMAKALAESIPTAGRALVADLDRLPDDLREHEHFALMIATLRRQLAKQDAVDLAGPSPKAPKPRRP